MIGAIIGDIVGSRFEFDPIKTKDFPLFSNESRFTDDTVLTIAVCEAILKNPNANEEEIKQNLVQSIKSWANRYPDAGYGGSFYKWMKSDQNEPYNSYGNGSAMRVSSVAWLYDDINRVREVARYSAEVTHNHPEGIKGAEATASAIFLARTSATRDEIKEYVEREFGYDLNRKVNDFKKEYSFNVTCQGSVPEAIICFLESTNYEDCIRTAVSLGGDSDTQACIAGGIAEAFYELPTPLEIEGMSRLPAPFLGVLNRFNTKRNHTNPYFKLNSLIAKAIHDYNTNRSNETLNKVLTMIHYCMASKSQVLLPADIKKNPRNPKQNAMVLKQVKASNGQKMFVMFTDDHQLKQGVDKTCVSVPMIQFFNDVMKSKNVDGVIINPWHEQFVLPKQFIEAILNFKKEEKDEA